ncbi:MAG: 2-amino-4-hydroxy-6-hydroxymethyldihydropteridine diphosphokinase [Thermanaerothrix sp.]|jgi:2-amino-4-hydroxy-6-hydroxymethyldihydropteridine diphosphokinase|uniref:Bifunctional folate synthesis protein n=1 Tax=Thermanaerothrix solaris TaxID=3058434 RepID=A0ABU3NIX7_9CHLR|nr:2-amino-4-hydroxy-6-hydroxymethyldihydropteridine diphosphokinase [Thermanaerothrix sp. 4228-RoL]MDT8896799.1 2-amino-4-hydroxy-6-hydroxymethyldihydropteridine diphosphokinase [Thermanaerothrix sp. 4228-RoL]
MDITFIQDLLVRGVIGISDRERSQPQDILINLVLFGDVSKAAQTDRIEDCINYRTIAKKITAYVERAERYTVEALAADIARLSLEEPNVIGVRVRVEKPGAVRFARSVGVEIERFRDSKTTPAMHQAYILLGSNIEPEVNIAAAIHRLKESCVINAISSIWETEAVGSPGPRFLNAVVWLSTPLDLEALKKQILAPIEQALGRVRTPDKNAPRTIDLDVLIFDDRVLDSNIWQRDFIALPLAELRPDLSHSTNSESLAEIAQRLRSTSSAFVRSDLQHLSRLR